MKKAICMILCIFVIGGCGFGKGETEQAVYRLTLEGAPKEPGVVSFEGYEMNVYEDQASNPCGDCRLQPVSVFVGDDASAIAKAIEEAVIRADYLWEVVSVEGAQVTLREKEEGTVSLNVLPQAPAGLVIKGEKLSGGELTGLTDSTAEGAPLTDGLIKLNDSRNESLRIAAVYGPAYEALVVLGVEEQIVVCADVQVENFPWAKEIFAYIGKMPCLENVHSSVNIEELVGYGPDLVYSFPRPNEEKKLAEAGVRYLSGSAAQSLSDVPAQLKAFALPLGQEAQARAEAYEAYFEEKRAFVAERTKDIPEKERPVVYFAGVDLLTTYGRYSDIPELIEEAGGRASTRELEAGSRTQINYEQLVSYGPDFIFIDHGGMNERTRVEEIMAEAYADGRYSVLPAVAKKQIYLTPSGVFYWDMGLQKILLLVNMAKILHPGLFEDVDMVGEIKTFYASFYSYELNDEQALKILNREEP